MAENIVIKIAADTASAAANIGMLYLKISSLQDIIGSFSKPLTKAALGYMEFAGTIFQNSLQIKASFDMINSATSKITETTAKFAAFRATLTTALSSSIASEVFMKRIEDFAKVTPFSVAELTESFVKLANRGVLPTMQGFKRVGDFAASTGKSFQQVTEAILDAGSSTERWMELGVKLHKVGNNIEGSYRGVNLVFANTSKGAMEMVEAFGQLNGVSGGMELRSLTLGGKLSNLGDATEQFYDAVGRAGEPIYDVLIPAMQNLLEWTGKSSGGLRSWFAYFAGWLDYIIQNRDAIIGWIKTYIFLSITFGVLKTALMATIRIFLFNTAVTYAMTAATKGFAVANEFVAGTISRTTKATSLLTLIQMGWNGVQMIGIGIARMFGFTVATNTVIEAENTVATVINTSAVATNSIVVAQGAKTNIMWSVATTVATTTTTLFGKALQWLWFIVTRHPLAIIVTTIITAIGWFLLFSKSIRNLGEEWRELAKTVEEQTHKMKVFITEMTNKMLNIHVKVKLSLTVNPDQFLKQEIDKGVGKFHNIIKKGVGAGLVAGVTEINDAGEAISAPKFMTQAEVDKLQADNAKKLPGFGKKKYMINDAMTDIAQSSAEAYKETLYETSKKAAADNDAIYKKLAEDKEHKEQYLSMSGQELQRDKHTRKGIFGWNPFPGILMSEEEIKESEELIRKNNLVMLNAQVQYARFNIIPDAAMKDKDKHKKSLMEHIVLDLNEYAKVILKIEEELKQAQIDFMNTRLSVNADWAKKRRDIEGINEFDAMQMDEYDKIAKEHINNNVENNKKLASIFLTRNEQIKALDKEYIAEKKKGEHRLAEIEKHVGHTSPEDAEKQVLERDKQQKELIRLQMNYASERRFIDKYTGEAAMEQTLLFYQKEAAAAEDHMNELLLIEAKIQKHYIENAKTAKKEIAAERREKDIMEINDKASPFNKSFKYTSTPDWKLLRLNQKNQTADLAKEYDDREKLLKETFDAQTRLAQEFKDAELAALITKRNAEIAKAEEEESDLVEFEIRKLAIIAKFNDAAQQIQGKYDSNKEEARTTHLGALALLQNWFGLKVNNLDSKQEEEKAALRKTYFEKSITFLQNAASQAFSVMNTFYDAEKTKIQTSIDIHKQRRDVILQSLNAEGIERRRYTIGQLAAEEKRIDELNKLKKEEVEKQKLIAQAQIVLQTAVTIANIVATQSAIPGAAFLIPFEIALAIGTMFASIAASRATAEASVGDVYEKGGIVGGRYHSQGGTMIEAERDEAIFSRKHTKEFRPLFDDIWAGRVSKDDIYWGNNIPKQVIIMSQGKDNAWRASDINRLITATERISKKDNMPIRLIR